MTLLFCPHCTEAFTLRLDEWRSCRCGNASGVLRSNAALSGRFELAGDDGEWTPDGLGGGASIAGGRLVRIDAAELLEALADGPVSLEVARIQRAAVAI